MEQLQKNRLRGLMKDILTGAQVDDLTLIIKGAPSLSESAKSATWIFERRRNSPDSSYEVSNPKNRILGLSSRSPQDLWTIIHKDRVVAKGEFFQIQKAISGATKQIITYPSAFSRYLLIYSGVLAFLLFSLFIAVVGNRLLLITKIQPGQDVGYAQNLINFQKSLSHLAKQNEVIKSILTPLLPQITDIKNNLTAKELQEPREIQEKQRETFETRLSSQIENADLNTLVALEARKSELYLKDKELDEQGYLPSYGERRNILITIQAVDKQINEIKNKYKIPSN